MQLYLIMVHKMMTSDEADTVMQASFVVAEKDLADFTGKDFLPMFPDISDMPVTNLRAMSLNEVKAYRVSIGDDYARG